jgi:hypothetical protein
MRLNDVMQRSALVVMLLAIRADGTLIASVS